MTNAVSSVQTGGMYTTSGEKWTKGLEGNDLLPAGGVQIRLVYSLD